MKLTLRYLIPLLFTVDVLAVPTSIGTATEPDPANFVSVTLNGQTFIDKGMVAFGLIPADFQDSTGNTFGGVGSAIAIQHGTWTQNSDGTFSGSLIVQPDRGFNVDGTVNFQGRQHIVDFVLSPYYDITPLSFTTSQQTLAVTYRSSLLYTERQGKTTTGLDALAVRAPEQVGLIMDPPDPIANTTFNHLCLDAEGLALNADGTFWVSDEYGPYVHLFDPQGDLVLSIQPPQAFLPFQQASKSSTPVLNFTGSENPTTGRVANQGFEGLTQNPLGTKLFALLQSATVQDGGADKTTSQNTRLLVYNVTGGSTSIPVLTAEYVVPLPQNPSSGNTFAQSEFHYLTDTQFLILARDGKGNGDGSGNEESKYKNVDLFDISQATNIAGTVFDEPSNPIANDGTIVKGITPALYQPFISMIDSTQLGRFGLHNGKPINSSLLNSKWESLAVAPVGDPEFPEDYFIFTVSDNDFLTTNGFTNGVPYNAGLNVDTQFMVWRATLPSIQPGWNINGVVNGVTVERSLHLTLVPVNESKRPQPNILLHDGKSILPGDLQTSPHGTTVPVPDQPHLTTYQTYPGSGVALYDPGDKKGFFRFVVLLVKAMKGTSRLVLAFLFWKMGSIFAIPSFGKPPIHPTPPPAPKLPEPDSANFVNVTLNGRTFINKGMVAFGLIPAAFRDSTGETFGGVGSAIALKRGTWKQNNDGSFTGSLIVQPDRGFNVDGTINYQGRQHEVEFTLNPYYDSTPLSFNASQKTLALQYKSTLLYTERQHKTTTGLDSLAVRNPELVGLVLDPLEPIANNTFSHLNLDAEGLVLNSDGTSWVSDEYGPYVHLFSSEGSLIRSIQPSDAVLPFQDIPGKGPVLNFTASVDPSTGRAGNQGFEGLTANPSETKLFVLLQSATIQDGGSNKATQQNTRLYVYDTILPALIPPIYAAQYVVTLPVKSKNNHTFAQSEFHYLSDTEFLVLARDGNGNGDGVGNEKSDYKNIDLFDISEATNIAHTQFDTPDHPIAVDGVVVEGIQPAKYQPFISMIDPTQLARFGLHNGVPIDPTLLNSKWESLAVAPVGDPGFPDDYFIITASDNDFLTTDGVAAGMHYDAGSNVDSQFMVWRATLPSIQRGTVETSIGIN